MKGGKTAVFACLAAVLMLMAGCAGKAGEAAPAPAAEASGAAEPSSSGEASGREAPLSETDRRTVDLCLAAIDWVYQEDDGLNGGIELLALDDESLAALPESAREALKQEVAEAYDLPVITGTYESLRDQGLIVEREGFEKGLLIRFSCTPRGKNKAGFTAEKYRGPLGAYGTSDGVLELRDGDWVVAGTGACYAA